MWKTLSYQAVKKVLVLQALRNRRKNGEAGGNVMA
jgi:hypothetical protein